MKVLRSVVVVLFFLSVFYYVISRIILQYILFKKGARIPFFLSGIPFYLEYVFSRASSRIKTHKLKLFVSSIFVSLIVSILLAILTFILINYY